MKSLQKQHIHQIIFICLLIVVGWGQDCDVGYTEIYGECYFQSDLDVLQDFIDLNESLIGMVPLQVGSSQTWTNGHLCEINFTRYNDGYYPLINFIPESIITLSCLTELNFTNQQFNVIPDLIFDLTNLTHLNLSMNTLTNIPLEIGNLVNLEVLFLNQNQIIGEIPLEIFNLINLTSLSLSQNQITGEIPPEIGQLTNLGGLSLMDNQLTGEIPLEIFNLINLTSLYLLGNQLIGEIPSEIGNLINLNTLWIGFNQLSGQIPENLCNLWNTNMNTYPMSISGNQFCPPYPSCLFGYEYLDGQDTSNCIEPVCTEGLYLIDNICFNESDIDVLQEFINENTSLNGMEPLDIGNQDWDNGRLTFLNLIDKQITQLPESIGNVTYLQELDLSFNQLTTIPFSIGNLTELEIFNISNNNFTNIPFGIYNLSLIFFDLSNNHLTGQLSSIICEVGLNLDISNNLFCPPYPECLTEESIGYQDTTNCSSMSIPEPSLPIQYTLNQPFPNPFNPTTSISFSIPEQSQTSLKVYDIKGNFITTLLNQAMNVGLHQIEWNGENLSSGTYFIRINSGEFSDVAKVVLVK